MSKSRKNVAVLGFGRLGSHLYYALKKTRKYSVTVINNKKKKSTREPDVIFIAVPDDKIKEAAKFLANEYPLKNKIILHTSGVLTSELLHSLKRYGAETGSFHPVQTFETKAANYSSRFRDIYIAIEGTKQASQTAEAIAKDLGSYPFFIPKEKKVLHHIACVFASNYLIALLNSIRKFIPPAQSRFGSVFLSRENTNVFGIFLTDIVKDILLRQTSGKKNGFQKHRFFSIYEPLVRQTFENIQSKGIKGSLTGPIERNDLQTIKLHLRELKKYSELSVYKFLARETAAIALEKKSLTPQQFKRITQILN